MSFHSGVFQLYTHTNFRVIDIYKGDALHIFTIFEFLSSLFELCYVVVHNGMCPLSYLRFFFFNYSVCLTISHKLMGLKSFPTYDTTKGMETIYSSISRMPKFSPHLYQHFPEISTQLLQISPVVNHEIFLGLFEIYRHLRTNFPTAGLFDCCPISR